MKGQLKMYSEFSNFEKEKREAIEAGYAALDALNAAKHSLANARGWGIFDTFFGGGFISSALKHSNMNDANRRCSKKSRQCHNTSRSNYKKPRIT